MSLLRACLLMLLSALLLCGVPASALAQPDDLGPVKPHVAAAAREFRAEFPGILSIGGHGPGSVPASLHPHGLALDLMVGSDKPLGERITAYAIDNAERLAITEVIWDHRFWSDGVWARYGGPSPHTDHPHLSFSATPPAGAPSPASTGDVVTDADAGSSAGAASAEPAVFGVGDCKEPPTPEFPGSGMVGQIDPPSPSQGVPGSAYHEVGYGGQVWHTYDLGCGPDAAADPAAVGDTWLGNMLFDGAKFVVAVTIAVDDAVTEGGLLDRLDELIVSGTVALYQGVFLPLVGLALLLLGLVCLVLAMRGDLATISRKGLAALIGLGLASAMYLTPLLYVTAVDGALVTVMHQLRSGLLTEAGVDAQHGLSQTLHEQVVYEAWLAGEFGSATSGDARALGRDLVRAQTFTRAEVASGTTGEQATDAKKERFEQVADSVAPATYPYLTGNSVHRTGVGLFALLESLVYASFQLVAGVVVFVCLLVLRMLVLLAPVLGLVAMLRHQTLAEMAQAAGTAVWQALYLTVVAAIHLIAMVYIASLALPGLGALLLMFALTVVLWWAVGPWRRLRSMVAASAAVAGAEVGAGRPRRRIDFDLERERRSETVSVPREEYRAESGPPSVSATAERVPDVRPERYALPEVVEGAVTHAPRPELPSGGAGTAVIPDSRVERRSADLTVYRPRRAGWEERE